jgi:hypothetical protein
MMRTAATIVRHIALLFSLLRNKKSIFYWSLCLGANLTTMRVSISKLLHFACPLAKRDHFEYPIANVALGTNGNIIFFTNLVKLEFV